MNIAIIGSGTMGSGFARRLAAAGYSVALTAKDLDKARAVAREIGMNIRVIPSCETTAWADLIIASAPYQQQVEALRCAGDLTGKVVVEVSNPLKPDMSGLLIGHTTSAAEEIAKAIPGAKVVKAFNTIFSQILAESSAVNGGVRTPVYYAGDDEGAKAKVRVLIETIGFEPVDAGPLSNARYLEPMAFLNIWFGFVAKQGYAIAPAWIRR